MGRVDRLRVCAASLGALLAVSCAVACGAFDGDGDGEGGGDAGAPPPDGASADGSAAGDAKPVGDAGAAVDSGSDASRCDASGPLTVDPTFDKKALPLTVARTVVTSSGQVYSIGRSGCGGVTHHMSLHHFAPDGTGSGALGCFGFPETEVSVAMAATTGGFLFATFRQTVTPRAHLRRVTPAGVASDLDAYAIAGTPTYPTVVATVGDKNVWGGYSAAMSGDVGVLRVVGGGSVALAPYEVPIAAAARGAEIFVLLSASPSEPTASPYVVLRRYNLAASTLNEDPVFSSADRTRVTLPAAPLPQSADPDGIVMGDGVLTFAVYKGPSFGLFTLEKALSNPIDFTGFGIPQVAGGCNGSVLVATVKSGGNIEVTRRVGSTTVGAPAIFGGNGVSDLGAAADGTVYIAGSAAGASFVSRLR